MADQGPRITREKRTIESMIGIFCKGHHKPKSGICSECSELLDYAHSRLDKCPFSEEKPTCAKCTVHCYMPVMRGKAKAVMRYSGPKMIYSHPVLAVLHIKDSRRKTPREKYKEK